MLEIQKTRVRSLSWEDLLEEEMATHPNILAWKILWTDKPGRLQSLGSQRIRHDLAHKAEWWRQRDQTMQRESNREAVICD